MYGPAGVGKRFIGDHAVGFGGGAGPKYELDRFDRQQAERRIIFEIFAGTPRLAAAPAVFRR